MHVSAKNALEMSPERVGLQKYKPLYNLLMFLLFLLPIALIIDLSGWTGLWDFWNWAFPISLLIGCLWTAGKIVRKDGLTLWTPVPWFLAATATYFGFGPLLYTFGNPETIHSQDHFWQVDNYDLLRTNLINLIGVLVIIGSFIFLTNFLPVLSIQRPVNHRNTVKVKSAMILFLAVGLPIKYLIVIPYAFGLTSFILPGSILFLQNLVLIGLLLLGYLSVSGKLGWKICFILLFITEFSIAFLQFNKSEVLLVPIMALLGRFLAHRRIATLMLVAIIVFSLYFIINPVVGQSRNETAKITGIFSQATLSERIYVLKYVIHNHLLGNLDHNNSSQGWWSRLCYTPSQAFGIHQYDSGKPGNSYGYLPYTFIPRFIWTNKPIITDVGLKFNMLVLGFDTSYSALGIFGEAYWNMGYPGVIMISAFVGILFAVLSWLALLIMFREEWIFLPCVFMGIKMGFRIDGWFISDYFGASVIYIAFLGVFHFFNKGGKRIPRSAY